MNFSEKKADEVLISDAIAEYKRYHDFFYIDQLLRLGTNIYIIEKVINFPFNLFTIPMSNIFFSMVIHNFYNASILIITKLASDSGDDVFTLKNFKNWVREKVKDEFKNDFHEHLRQAKFDKKTYELVERAKKLRNKSIAHIIKKNIGKVEIDPLNFAELKKLHKKLWSVYDVLSFRVQHSIFPWEYYPSIDSSCNDIERIFCDIAKKSELLELKEKNPNGWEKQREILSEEEIKKLNIWRLKLGLPEV